MPFAADLPYPSLDGIRCDPVAARIVAPTYSGMRSELTAILQYIYHHFVFESKDQDDIANTIAEIAVTEMHHFDILGSMLLKLGANPIMTEMPPFPRNFFSTRSVCFSNTPRQMLQDDIAGETNAIADYRRMLSRLCNPDVAAVIERIIADEELHLRTFTELLDSLPNEGC